MIGERDTPDGSQPQPNQRPFNIHGFVAQIRQFLSRGESQVHIEPIVTSERSNVAAFSFNRAPRVEGGTVLVDERGPIFAWREKFRRPNHTFSVGDRVLASGYIEEDSKGETRIVVEADRVDGRLIDYLYPLGLPTDVEQNLDELRGIALDCKVRIREVIDRGYQVSDIKEYYVDLEPGVTKPPVNPTREELLRLPNGSKVALEGRVAHIPTGELAVQAEDGRILALMGLREYRGGILENIRDKYAQLGELIRLTGYVYIHDGNAKIGVGFASPYLLEPSPQRIEEFNKLRARINRHMNELNAAIGVGNFLRARNLFGRIRREDLTREESSSVLIVRDSFPENERPIIDQRDGRRHWARTLDHGFRTMVESMAKDQYLQFVRDIGMGRISRFDKDTDPRYAYEIMMGNDYSSETMLSVLSETLDERLRRLELASDEPKDYFPHSWIVRGILVYLSEVPIPEATAKLVEVLKYGMEHKYYPKKGMEGIDYPRKFSMLLYHATEWLLRSVKENPGNLAGVQNPEELRKWRDELISEGKVEDTEAKRLIEIVALLDSSI